MTPYPTMPLPQGDILGNYKGHISPPSLKEEPKLPEGIHLPKDPLLKKIVLLGLQHRGIIPQEGLS